MLTSASSPSSTPSSLVGGRRGAISNRSPARQWSRQQQNYAVFGTNLEELIHRPDHDAQPIPIIVRQCLKFLSNPEHIKREGLLRTPGRESDIIDLRNRFDNGAHVRFHPSLSPDTIASLLKLYLGSLQEPLFESRLTPELLNAIKNSKNLGILQDIKKLIDLLKPEHKQLMTDIFAFAVELVQNTDSNRMNSTSCGIVLGPVIFRTLPEMEDRIGMMEQIRLLNKATTFIIDNFPELFDPETVSYTKENENNMDEQENERLLSVDLDTRLQAALSLRTEYLSLQGQTLKHKLKDEDLFKLSSLLFLRELDLSSNLIQDLPDKFPPNVERLNLSKNNMKSPPRNLEMLRSLKSLNLRLNEIKAWPKGINTLENLEELDLAFNAISSIQYNMTLMGLFGANSNNVPPMTTSLTSLDLSFNHMTEFPRKILDFRKLRNINLTANSILDLPDDIEVLQEILISLRVSRCGFTRFPHSIYKLYQLQTLDISGNPIRVLPVEISYLPQLRELNISNTNIESIYPVYFLQRLEVLNASNNAIEKIPNEFQYLRNLRELNISRNKIQAIPDSILCLQKLELFDANKNQIKTVSSSLALLTDLRVLRLESNSISHFPSLEKLHQLRILVLSSNELRECPLGFEQLGNSLEQLELDNNQIGVISQGTYNLTNLQRLNLQNNAITELKPEIGQLISLNYLNLDNNLLDRIPAEIVNIPLKTLSFNNNGEIQLSEEMIAWRDANNIHISAKFDLADKVLQGLYIGSQSAAVSRNALQKLGITHVLTIAKNIPPPHPDHFTYFVVEENDVPATNLKKYFDACNKFIDEGRAVGGVIIHCQAGVSRSATITTAYLMHNKRITLKRAFSHLRKVRPQVFPIAAFRRQLQAYNDELFGDSLQVAPQPQKASPEPLSPLTDQPSPFDQE